MKFKRYCKVLALKNDPKLIAAYKKVHAMGNAWPEISMGMKEVGIIDMEIYVHENRLFMIMDTVPDFDHENAMAELAQKPRQGEWEAYVSQFQMTSKTAIADKKWQLIDRIYELNQQKEYNTINGQEKEIE